MTWTSPTLAWQSQATHLQGRKQCVKSLMLKNSLEAALFGMDFADPAYSKTNAENKKQLGGPEEALLQDFTSDTSDILSARTRVSPASKSREH